MTRAKPFPQTLVLLVLALLGCVLTTSLAPAARNDNPAVLPPHANAYGMSYGEWSEEWWKWAVGIPAAQNPGLDETGEFGSVGQEGHVWFLAGLYGSDEVERTVTVPAGKPLFFPLYNWVWWAPDDLGTAEFLAVHLGFTPEEIALMTDEELIRLAASYTAGEPELTCTVDGRELQNLHQYYAESSAFQFLDTDLFDDFGIPISQPNLAVAAGYWVMLAPLPVGEHTIHWAAHGRHSVPAFDGDLVVTYHINVVPRK